MRKASSDDDVTVQNALIKARIYDKIITLPDGMDTVLTREFNESCSVLSGGQYQKIVVARAFANDAPIMVFDEPSSALDPIAEYELFDSIMQESRDKMMVFISHRLSSVQNADIVFMLEQGELIEQGTHQSLMKLGKAYADMYKKQAENYLAEESYPDIDKSHKEYGGSIFTGQISDKEVAI